LRGRDVVPRGEGRRLFESEVGGDVFGFGVEGEPSAHGDNPGGVPGIVARPTVGVGAGY